MLHLLIQGLDLVHLPKALYRCYNSHPLSTDKLFSALKRVD